MLLEETRVDAEPDDPEDQQHHEPGDEEAPAHAHHLDQAGRRARHRQRGEPAEDRQRGVDVGVGGAEHDPARREEQIEAVEPEARGAQEQEQRAQGQEVQPRRRGEPGPARGEDQAPLQDVHRRGEDDRAHHQRGGPAVEEPPERQLEEVEAEVAAEQRIHPPERGGVHVREDDVPGGGGARPGHEGDDRHHGQEQPADERLEDGAAGEAELVLELPVDVGRRRARGQRQVREQKQEDGAAEPEEEPAVERQPRGEDLGEPDLVEPEPVRVERNGLPARRDDAHGEQQPEAEPRARSSADRRRRTRRHARSGDASRPGFGLRERRGRGLALPGPSLERGSRRAGLGGDR